jgi:1,4-alpha-glucan branching enzyme
MSYRIPVHHPGTFQQLFNSDAKEFGGTGQFQIRLLASEPVAHRGREHSLVLDLPPLAALVLKLERILQ